MKRNVGGNCVGWESVPGNRHGGMEILGTSQEKQVTLNGIVLGI